MSGPKPLPKQYFFDEPLKDAMINSLTNLTLELSVVRERLDIIETILDEHGSVTREQIDAFTPQPASVAMQMGKRMALIQAVMDPFKSYFASAASSDLS